MTINTCSGETFIPVAGGNDKADRPVAFRLQFLTVEDQSEIEYFEYVGVSAGKTPKVRVKVSNAEYFRRGVVKVEGLEVDGKPVETAEAFLALRGPAWMKDMVAETALRLKNAMEIPLKN